jgi:hypothetical protein
MQLYRCGTLPVFAGSIKRNAVIGAVEMSGSTAFISKRVLNLNKKIIELVVVMTAVDQWKSRQEVLVRAR